MFGKWEVYYSTKLIIENPGSNPKPFPDFRDILFDGFTYDLEQKSGKYTFTSYNAIGVQIRKGIYETKKDSLIFYWDTINAKGEDSVAREGRKVLELNFTKGIIKWQRSYMQITKDGKTRYSVTDGTASRDVDIAPNSNSGVNPAKAKIDFNDLCIGKWVITKSDIYYDGDIQPGASNEETKKIAGTIYDYYINGSGEKRCRWTPIGGTMEDHQIKVIDDVIYHI